MHSVFQKDQMITIPNLLSFLRLGLIPIILWLYCEKNDPYWAAAIILLSGITDVADGIIARKFHMISDFGKILDPIADKLTQAAILVCLITKFPEMRLLVIVFFIKEFLMAAMGYLVIRKTDAVNSAQWHGKLNTVLLYTVMMVLILFPGIPAPVAAGMIDLCIIMVLLSLVLYARFYYRLLRCKDRCNQG